MIGRIGRVLELGAVAVLLAMGGALASETNLGAPVPWGMGLQASGGPIKDAIHAFNTMVFWIIVARLAAMP